MRSVTLTIIAIILMFGFISVPADAEASNVKIDVKIVYASMKGQEVDPKISSFLVVLASMFDFKTYKMEAEHTVYAKYKSSKSITLPGNRKMVLTPQNKDADSRVKLKVQIEDLVKTDFRLKDGGQMIIGGPKYKDGVLILIISAKEE